MPKPNPNRAAITPEIADTVAHFRTEGWDEQRIATKVGLTLDEVMSVDQGEPAFTAKQDALILSLRNEKGRLWMRIAEEIGSDITGDQVKRRYGRLMRHSLRGRKVARAGRIECLGPCGQKFDSRDTTNNRMCERCGRAAANAAACGISLFSCVTATPDLRTASEHGRMNKRNAAGPGNQGL